MWKGFRSLFSAGMIAGPGEIFYRISDRRFAAVADDGNNVAGNIRGKIEVVWEFGLG
jgi:hypothetical protein